MPVVVARGLAKTYGGGVAALAGMDLAVHAGEIVGLVGENGAGKTTALEILSGRLAPTSGTVSVLGVDAGRDPLGVRALVGALPAADATFELLTGGETVELIGRLHGLSREDARRRATDLLDLVLLAPDDRERVAREYSTGMRRKVQLAAALVHAPRVLILDEPLAGLDPAAAHVVRRVVRTLAREGRAALVSSHALDTLERLCDRFVVLHRGRVAAEGTLDALRERSGVADGAPLEDVFVALVGGAPDDALPEWLS